MPENWSFEAAATVPTVFLTVYYALKQLAALQPGERVLIHGAAGESVSLPSSLHVILARKFMPLQAVMRNGISSNCWERIMCSIHAAWHLLTIFLMPLQVKEWMWFSIHLRVKPCVAVSMC